MFTRVRLITKVSKMVTVHVSGQVLVLSMKDTGKLALKVIMVEKCLLMEMFTKEIMSTIKWKDSVCISIITMIYMLGTGRITNKKIKLHYTVMRVME